MFNKKCFLITGQNVLIERPKAKYLKQTLFSTPPFLFLYVPPFVVHDGGIVFGPAVGLDVRVCGRFDHLPRCWARNSTGSTWPVSSLEDVDKPFNKSHNFLKFFCELCNDRTGFRYL